MNEPVAWIEKDGMVRFDVKWASQMQGKEPIPLYTHLIELNAGGEPVKNASYWKRQHDGLLMKLNTSAIKISELEKELAKYPKQGQSIPCQYTEGM